MSELEKRRRHTIELIDKLQGRITTAGRLADSGQACVCATGSVGRLEAGHNSDVDLVIVTRGRPDPEKGNIETAESCLNGLDEICLKADIIDAMRLEGISELDGDGKYFKKFTTRELIDAIGKQHDDWENNLTSRLLLILESRPILGTNIHSESIRKILQSYWADYEGHEEDYAPAFFTNDVLRLWRTFCVNYEARTRTLGVEDKMVRRVKNLKLKYSRMLTCYSAIIFLLDEFDKRNAVSLDAACHMATLTPIERFLSVSGSSDDGSVKSAISTMVDRYTKFLEETDRPKAELMDYMKLNFEKMRREAHEFGDSVFDAMSGVGKRSRFYRMVVV